MRFSLLTVSLLCALLLVLGSVVYVLTQQTQRQALSSILQDSARHQPFPLDDILLGRRGGAGNGPQPHGQRIGGQPPPAAQPLDQNVDRNGVIFTVINMKLKVVAQFGPRTPGLFDRAAAQRVLRTGREACCSQISSGGHTYLVDSLPVLNRDNGSLLGVVQAGISEDQYQAGLRALLKGLILVSTLGLVAAAAISSLLAQRALGPIRISLRRQRDFVADAAHELRTPLAIARTAAELGLNSGQLAELQTALEQSLAQNSHLARLVDSLSLLARADSGVLELELRPLDLTILVRAAVESMEVLAEDRAVRMSVTADEHVEVLGDPDRLRQLLVIVLDNALKFAPDGGAIDVGLHAGNGKAQLTVRDSGPGIDPRHLPHLFERFYRADRARSGEGMGLGLAIGRWIAEAHGGRIAAANASKGGALFTITLPWAQSRSDR
jgi:signal transduction histidine kinase